VDKNPVERKRNVLVDGGDGLQIWRVVSNILNKQSRTADSGRSSSLEAGLASILRNVTQVIGLERLL
jgi:hypothetical protein